MSEAALDDASTQTGAQRLADRIAQYWRDKGFNGIKTWTVESKMPWQLRRKPVAGSIQQYEIRSNIGRNGYPPRS